MKNAAPSITKAAIEFAGWAEDAVERATADVDLVSLIAHASLQLGECAREVLKGSKGAVPGPMDAASLRRRAVALGALCCLIAAEAEERMVTAPEAARPCTDVPWDSRRLRVLASELADSARAAADPARDGSAAPLVAVDEAADRLEDLVIATAADDVPRLRQDVEALLTPLSVGRRERELARRIRLVLDGRPDEEPVGVCPECGATVPQDERTCPKCGLTETREG